MTLDITRLDFSPWTVWVVNTGTSTYPRSVLYPDLPQGPHDTVDVPNNALILHDGEHLVLLDTGLPADPNGESDAPIYRAICELDFTPESVDAVIISHLHPDHLGPLLDGHRPTAAFPNAVFYVHSYEWAYFSDSQNLERHAGRVADAVRIALPLLARTRLTLFEEPCSPFRGLTVRLAGGHTPGHCITDIGTPPCGLYIADLVAHQQQLEVPALASGFDQAHRQAEETRVAVLSDARQRHAQVIGSHFAVAQEQRTT